MRRVPAIINPARQQHHDDGAFEAFFVRLYHEGSDVGVRWIAPNSPEPTSGQGIFRLRGLLTAQMVFVGRSGIQIEVVQVIVAIKQPSWSAVIIRCPLLPTMMRAIDTNGLSHSYGPFSGHL